MAAGLSRRSALGLRTERGKDATAAWSVNPCGRDTPRACAVGLMAAGSVHGVAARQEAQFRTGLDARPWTFGAHAATPRPWRRSPGRRAGLVGAVVEFRCCTAVDLPDSQARGRNAGEAPNGSARRAMGPDGGRRGDSACRGADAKRGGASGWRGGVRGRQGRHRSQNPDVRLDHAAASHIESRWITPVHAAPHRISAIRMYPHSPRFRPIEPHTRWFRSPGRTSAAEGCRTAAASAGSRSAAPGDR